MDDVKTSVREQFTRLYTPLVNELFRYAYYFIGDKNYAEDAVSEAAVNAYINFTKLSDHEKFKPWIFKILCNVCKKQLKNFKNKQIDIENAENRTDSEIDGQNFSEKLETSILLKSALDSLKPTEKTVVMLCTVGKYTSQETAKILNIPSSTVRSHLKRSLAKLKILLGKDFFDEK